MKDDHRWKKSHSSLRDMNAMRAKGNAFANRP